MTLLLMLLVQALPVKELCKYFSQQKIELAAANEDETTKNESEDSEEESNTEMLKKLVSETDDYFIIHYAIYSPLARLSSATMVGESNIPLNHSTDILVPPPNA